MVSLHLRARRTGGSQQGTAAFLRAFARLARRNAGREVPALPQNDVLDAISRALADAADKIIDDAVLQISKLAPVLRVGCSYQSSLTPQFTKTPSHQFSQESACYMFSARRALLPRHLFYPFIPSLFLGQTITGKIWDVE